MKNFQDIYSVQDMKLACEVCKTYDTGLSKIALKAPDQTCRLNSRLFGESSSSVDITYRTLKLEYAIQVWCEAIAIARGNQDDLMYFLWLRWKEDDTPFRHIEYDKFYKDITVEELTTRFWKLLEKIADSGDIKVTEWYHLYNTPEKYDKTKIACEIVIDEKNAYDIKIDNIHDYSFNRNEKTFSWDEIKDFFCELTLPQLELSQYKDIQKFDKSNDPLFDACKKWDVTGIEHALSNGAEINSLDETGVTPLTRAIESLECCCLDGDGLGVEDQEKPEIKSKVDQCIKVLDLLLGKGADVNLFGCHSWPDSPLEMAWQKRSKKVVKYLLDHGANPNANCELFDCISENRENWNRSSVMYSIDWLIGEEYGPVERDIEWMLRCAGARLYFWDYIPWEEDDVNKRIGKYVVRIDPSRENNKMFVDNSGWFIGSTKEISIEDEIGNITKIDVSSVEGIEEWLSEYQKNIQNGEYDWVSWKNRGKPLAYKIAKLLPDTVALFYLNDSDNVMYKSQWNDYYSFNHSDGYLRIK